MEVRDLRYFTSVVDSGSITRAAKVVGISQPALTRTIHVLEERLGAKLLVRSAKGVTMTSCGQALYLRAKSVIAELSRAEMEIAEMNHTRAGALTIGVLPSQAMNVLPQVAVEVMKTWPTLGLRVFEKPLPDLEAGLRRGEFDFIISLAPRNGTDQTLTHKALFYDQPAIVVRREHPIVALPTISLDHLASYPWILPPVGTERRAHVETLFSQNGLSISGGVIECLFASFIKKVVMQSDYIGLLQNDSPSQEEQAGLLCAITVEPSLPSREVCVVHRTEYPLTGAAQHLIREIQRACIGFEHRGDHEREKRASRLRVASLEPKK